MQRQILSSFKAPVLAAGAIVLLAGSASAQTTVTLPDTSQTTVLTAVVNEQARVTFPPGVTFNVSNITGSTIASPAAITISNIVLATASKQLKVSVQADAAAFTAGRRQLPRFGREPERQRKSDEPFSSGLLYVGH